MPAYIQHHEIETAPIVCPGCIGLLPMYVREVEPHWSMAKIDFIYECADCGAEVRQTIRSPNDSIEAFASRQSVDDVNDDRHACAAINNLTQEVCSVPAS